MIKKATEIVARHKKTNLISLLNLANLNFNSDVLFVISISFSKLSFDM